MRKSTVALLLGLLQLISCQDYDDLVKDVCFRKVYICADHRSRVTDSNDRFETNPFEFGEICRKHKKFIACVDDAVYNNCNESMSHLAQMTLNNRISLKMFCTDLERRKSYFSSVSCINENKDRVQKDCEYEESIHVDDRPWWCLIPEPCEAIQRIFNCTVQKMKGLCGATAADVFRRIQILDANNQDVVCEFRRLNPRYCRYERQKRHINVNAKDQIASSSSLHEKSETEAVYNVVRAVLMDAVNILEEQRQQDFSGIIDSDNVKLQKLLSMDEEYPSYVENSSKLSKRLGYQTEDSDLEVSGNSSGDSVTKSLYLTKSSAKSSTESNLESIKNINTESDSDSQAFEYDIVNDETIRSQIRELDDIIHKLRIKAMGKPRRFTEWISQYLVGTAKDPFYNSLNKLSNENDALNRMEEELAYFLKELAAMRAHEREQTKMYQDMEVESIERQREKVRQIERHNNEKQLERLNREARYREKEIKVLKEEKEEMNTRERKEKKIEKIKEMLRAYLGEYDEDERERNKQEIERLQKEIKLLERASKPRIIHKEL